MVPADSRRIPRVLRYSGTRLASSGRLRLRGFHPLRPTFPGSSGWQPTPASPAGPTTPAARRHAPGLGSSAFARRYWRNHCLFSPPAGTEMFQFPAFAPRITRGAPVRGGLPHSDIRGSTRICRSPRLFAACHVLLRLREPRHPPCALLSLSFYFLPPSGPTAASAVNRSGSTRLFLFYLLSRVHHVNDLPFGWRITGSNR